MIFETMEEWEIRDPIIKLLADKGVRRYPCIRLALNFIVFHVDFICKGDDFGQRYIFSSIRDFLTILRQSEYEKFTVSLQSRRCDNEDNEYGISTIKDIIKAKDKYDQTVYIIRCKNGKTYLDSHTTDNEKELTDKKVIYINQDS